MKPIKIKARWQGRFPRPGEYLKARRGRIAYRILEVQRIPNGPLPGGYRAWLICWRELPADLPPSARVYEWTWDRPTKRARTLSQIAGAA